MTGDGESPAGEESTEELRARLAAAVEAARDAYRHTTGLIRLLTVIGHPGTPEDLVEQTLTVLSEVFSADVTCVVRRLETRLLVRASCGLPEDDPAFVDGWSADPATIRTLSHPGRARAGTASGMTGCDLPPPFEAIGAHSAAWIPYGADPGHDGSDDVLVLCRHAKEPFTPADLEVLRSVAYRLRLAVQARERTAAIERLAQSGHRLARHLDLLPLLDEAVELLRSLTAANSAWVVTVDADVEGLVAVVRASSGRDQPTPPPRPAQAMPGWATMARGKPYVDNHPGVGEPLPGQALLGIPIMGESIPTALLYSARDRSHPFDRDVLDMAVIFANYLGVAMTNADLHRALVRSEASLRERATHDPLTGLANRVLAGQRLDEALNRRADDQVGLLFCDLDLFKSVNDRFGHEAGDLLLQQVASRLHSGVRATDVLSRFGGDEFVVILDGVNGIAEVTEIGERILRTLDAPFSVAGQLVRISASIGGVLGPRRRATAAAMLRDADAAMFIAKDRGPGQIEVLPTP